MSMEQAKDAIRAVVEFLPRFLRSSAVHLSLLAQCEPLERDSIVSPTLWETRRKVEAKAARSAGEALERIKERKHSSKQQN